MINKPESILTIDGRIISNEHPTYFIADIAANHDGDLDRAKDLIFQAKEAGADAVKFQHFQAETIVSDTGFKKIGHQKSHQASWSKSVFEIYKDASLDLKWTPELKKTCDTAGITFFSSPYALDLVDHLDSYVPAYKIGSGDVTWIEMIEHIAAKQKPYILATGASTMEDVQRAVGAGLTINPKLAIMQCNTNYTAKPDNFKYIQLNVLTSYQIMYPGLILGLSDHTRGHASVLGAVALGALMIEKHFTDDIGRKGPDHAFSMTPKSWSEMVERTRELENALGNGVKQVEANEQLTVVLQRRAIRARKNIQRNTKISRKHLTVLRPCPPDGIPPYHLAEIIGRQLKKDVAQGEHLKWIDLE